MRHLPNMRLVVMLCLACATSLAPAETINFDDAPVTPPPIDSNRYAGVVLPTGLTGAWIYALPSASYPTAHAKSGSNVLVSHDPSGESDPQPLVIVFPSKQESVTLYTGIPRNTGGHKFTLTLTAYGENDILVDTDTRYLAGPSDISERMGVAVSAGQEPAIIKIKLEHELAGFEFIDDLTFESSAPPPPPVTDPPIVYITTPTPETVISVGGNIPLAGTIHGEGLYPEVNRPVWEHTYWENPAYFDPPYVTWSQALMLPPQGTDLHWVTATPPYLAFNLEVPIYKLGANIITVTASNAAKPVGIGSAQTDVMLLPEPIKNKYMQDGGAAVFGQFVWGDASGDCQYAIYANGAIFNSSAGTFSVLGQIFTKWKSLANIGTTLGRLGCPTGPQKAVTAPDASGAYQDFEGGRIYSSPAGNYYVLEPFVDAIDKYGSVNPATSSFDKDYPGPSTPHRDFVMDYGFPVRDPVEQQNKILRPWLWQKFQTTINGMPLISTMEVTHSTMEGTQNPWTLWIATPDLDGVRRAGVLDNEISPRIPTIWRRFSCSQLGEPCVNVGLPASVPKTPYSQLAVACNHAHYGFEDMVDPDTPEWPPLRKVNTIDSCIGSIMTDGMAGKDAPPTHSCICLWTDFLKWGVDWCINIVPDPGFEWILGGDLIPPGNPIWAEVQQRQTKLEIEYEWCSVQYPPHTSFDVDYPDKKQSDYLKKGDKFFVAGRWISDCGCHPSVGCSDAYRSEIHPPAVMLLMYTEERLAKPATIAEIIYMDWWFDGEVVEVDIYPPPRPTPDVILSPTIPIWKDLCPSDGGHAGIETEALPASCPNHLHLKIKGRPDVGYNRPPKINSSTGQLYHGFGVTGRRCSGPGAVGRAVDPDWPHSQTLWGEFTLSWITP